ncbi:hypothetical protein BH23BAC1_BH23BAC1_27720 [soil metagenome]
MKKEDEKNKKTVEQLKKLKEADALREQLLFGPDLLIEKKGSDKSLDQRIEKIELISGETLDLIELRYYLDSKINEYEKKFSQEYYREIFRLHGWAIPENGIISKKPSIVAQYTKDYIYGRFPREVLPAIETRNKYDKIGMRLYKHFQFLTPKRVIELEKFIEDSITIMKSCNYWDQFVAKHAIAYGHPFQTSLFN